MRIKNLTILLGAVMCFFIWSPAIGQVTITDTINQICIHQSDSIQIEIKNPSTGTDTAFISIVNLADTIIVQGLKDTLAAGDSISLLIKGLSDLPTGDLVFGIEVRQDTIIDTIEVKIIIATLPPPSQLSFPEEGRDDIVLSSTFTWVPDGQDGYVYQLSLDESFNQLVREDTLNISFIEDVPLEESTIYYWRVKGINDCGSGEFSEPRSFTTIALFCYDTGIGGTVPLPGGDSTSFVEIQFSPEFDGIIDDFKVRLIAEHDSLHNIIMVVRSPGGESVTLFNNLCEEVDTIDALFEIDATLETAVCPASAFTTFNTHPSLSRFKGLTTTGVWSVVLEINKGGAGGSISALSLEMCIRDDGQELMDIGTEGIIVCPNETFLVTGTFGRRFDDSVTVTLEGPDFVTANYESNPVFWEDSLKMEIVIDQSSFIPGRHDLLIRADDGSTMDSHTINLDILRSPGDINPASPADQSTMVSVVPELMWSDGEEVNSFLLEIGLDAAFDSIVYSVIIDSLSHRVMDSLEYDTDYYWTVTAQGGCGSNPSDTLMFRTEMTTSVNTGYHGLLNIYPNPTIDNLVIETDLVVEAVEVVDLSGKIKLIERANPYQLHLGHLPKGIYIIRLKSSTIIVNRKIIKVE
jgi:hypothetical protein